MKRRMQLSAAVLLAAITAPGLMAAPAALQVSVEGAVQRPGQQRQDEGARFSDAVLAAMPRRDAYGLGASVFRAEAYAEQLRARAGLLHDLKSMAESLEAPGAVARRARALHAWVEHLPATGRLPLEGDARRLEAGRGDSNRLLAAGDRFFYPQRPSTVSVVGAVGAPCVLPHVAGRDALDYLRDCPVDAMSADADTLQVIQPDGQMQTLGIASWNRSQPQALAPGAIIYVPLPAKVVGRIAPELNNAMAAFLASQPLPHDRLVAP